jgi:hypothetical protein
MVAYATAAVAQRESAARELAVRAQNQWPAYASLLKRSIVGLFAAEENENDDEDDGSGGNNGDGDGNEASRAAVAATANTTADSVAALAARRRRALVRVINESGK